MKRILPVISLVLILSTLLGACGVAPATPDTQNALYFDDFSQSSSGWTQLSNDSGSIGYIKGQYQITIKKTATLFLATPGKSFPGDVSVGVEARKIDGSDDNYFGILCHYQDPDNYYMLMITSDGYAGIAMRKGGEDVLISPGLKFLKMEGIKTGDKTNLIQADCVGETLTLYANGVQVSLAYNSDLVGGDVGLAVRSSTVPGSVTVQFDNFIVKPPAQP